MPARLRLVRKVARSLERLGAGGGLVVAVSGGADSVALLRGLTDLGGRPLVVAHLNHGLRGAESDADEAFVHGLCGSLGVALRCERADVAARARDVRGNLEATARAIRYDWLAGVAREAGLGFVATAHTADDQAETVLHRLLRGSGLQGLRGIAGRRALAPGVEVVRPLLEVTRSEVLAYLEERGQPFREDSSNRDLSLTRNRIRHELLPHLAGRYNPEVAKALGRLAAQAQEVHAVQEGEARRLLAEVELPRAGGLLVFDRGRLAAAPRPRVREVFRVVWEREGWPRGRVDFAAWDRLAALVFDGGAAVDLPDGVRARRRGRVVQVGLGPSVTGGV